MHNHSQFLMPGLVCCHIHGEQVENAGANYDKPFFSWLIGDFIRISQKFARNQTYARNVASTIVVCIFCVQIWQLVMVWPSLVPRPVHKVEKISCYIYFNVYGGREVFPILTSEHFQFEHFLYNYFSNCFPIWMWHPSVIPGPEEPVIRTGS